MNFKNILWGEIVHFLGVQAEVSFVLMALVPLNSILEI